ncbi:hypothetical protein [Acinetobacter tandoii]|uniref:hypothetical protein n=1 Tax=Acinetobacter tandoii TaxID=202954 RepID=UPI003018B5D9
MKVEDATHGQEIDFPDGNIDRLVPVSTAELMGVSYQKNDRSIILEFGYIKNPDKEEVIIDTRKKLPHPMAVDLYRKLKEYFENEKK